MTAFLLFLQQSGPLAPHVRNSSICFKWSSTFVRQSFDTSHYNNLSDLARGYSEVIGRCFLFSSGDSVFLNIWIRPFQVLCWRWKVFACSSVFPILMCEVFISYFIFKFSIFFIRFIFWQLDFGTLVPPIQCRLLCTALFIVLTWPFIHRPCLSGTALCTLAGIPCTNDTVHLLFNLEKWPEFYKNSSGTLSCSCL